MVHPPTRPLLHPAVAVAGVLFGLAAVLAVVAVVYVALALTGHPGSSIVCGDTSSSMGECLLSSQVARTQTRETWAVGMSLAAGAITAAAGGGASLLLLLRRH